jgi:hypothetical protein
MKDMMGKKCKSCHKGVYQETEFHDDMNGVLHCPKCRDRVYRYPDEKKDNKKEEISFIKYESNLRDQHILEINGHSFEPIDYIHWLEQKLYGLEAGK